MSPILRSARLIPPLAFALTFALPAYAADPDLTIIPNPPGTLTAPTTAAVHVLAEFKIEIKNIGTDSTGSSFSTVLKMSTQASGANPEFLPAEYQETGTAGPLAPDEETSNFSIPFVPRTNDVGTRYFSICVDQDGAGSGAISESNEDNNCSAWTPITITTQPAPNLSINPANSTVTSPTIAAVGVSSNFTIGVKNLGVGTTGYFMPPALFTTASRPTAVLVSDLNADTKPDIVVTDSSANKISVLIASGNGQFLPKADYTTATTPYSLAAGDFTGDGKPDLVVGVEGTNKVSVFLNSGTGTFGAKQDKTILTTPVVGVAVTDVNGDTKLDIVAITQSPSYISVLLGNGNGTFQARVDYAYPNTYPEQFKAVTAGDFNNDGKPDLAIAEMTGGMTVALNNGSGGFPSGTHYALGLAGYGERTQQITAANLNGDGNVDLVLNDSHGKTILVFLGNGSGTFATHTEYFAGNIPTDFALGDINGDSKVDMVVSDYNGDLEYGLTTFYGDGSGGFTYAYNYPGYPGENPQGLQLADLDANGTLDLVAANSDVAKVGILFNGIFPSVLKIADDGAGAGSRYVKSATSTPLANGASNTASIAYTPGAQDAGDKYFQICADYSIKGVLQLPDTNTSNNCSAWTSVAVTAVPGSPVVTTGVASSVTTTSATLNGTVNPNGYTTTGWYRYSETSPGSCNNTFGTRVPTSGTSVGSGSSAVAIPSGGISGLTPNTTYYFCAIASNTNGFAYGALQQFGTSQIDLTITPLGPITSPSTTQIDVSTPFAIDIKNQGGLSTAGIFGVREEYGMGAYATRAAIGDLNGDGHPDLVAGDTSSAISVFISNGDGTFDPKVNYPAGDYPDDIAIGDLNGDGKADLAVTDSGAISVFINNGNGTFAAKVNYAAAAAPSSVAIGDVDDDGHPDLAVSNSTEGSVSIFINNGNGTFASKVDYAAGGSPEDIAIGDLDGDGKADLAVANNNLTIFINNGTGTFAPKVDYSGPAYHGRAIAMGDLDGDGKADVAVANQNSNDISVYINSGTGTFPSHVEYYPSSVPGNPSYLDPFDLAIGDLNGDGKLDIAVGGYGGLGVFFNSGTGTFTAPIPYEYPHATSLAMGDLNGDGKADLVLTNTYGGDLSVFFNGVFLNVLKIKDAAGSGTAGLRYLATATTTSPLAANSSTNNFFISYTPVAGDAGTKYFQICANQDLSGAANSGGVVEYNTANNCTDWTPITITLPVPACSTFTATPSTVNLGSSVDISWSCQNTTVCDELPSPDGNLEGFTTAHQACSGTPCNDDATPIQARGGAPYGIRCYDSLNAPHDFYSNPVSVVNPHAKITSTPMYVLPGNTGVMLKATCTDIPNGTANLYQVGSPDVMIALPVDVDSTGTYTFNFATQPITLQTSYKVTCAPDPLLGGATANATVTVKFKTLVTPF